MKPVELVEIAVRNSSARRDLVLDPFAGSGSTLAACERRRAARLLELDPDYSDVGAVGTFNTCFSANRTSEPCPQFAPAE